MTKTTRLLALSCAVLLTAPAAPQTPSPANQAWEAAQALKKKAAYREAAAAFEALAATDPKAPLAPGALVEAGVCSFSAGRAEQKLHRNTPPARESFDRALRALERVVAEYPTNPAASRAMYMQGSTYLFAGELELAEAAYGSVLDSFKLDPGYVAKALERRAFVRRHLLRAPEAISDYERWLKQYTTPPETVESVKVDLEFARTLGKPPLPVKAETWAAGTPVEFDQPSGDVIALYFFATWCDKCEAELPFILELERRYAPQGLRLVGVVDHSKGQTPDSVRKYLGERAITFSTLINSGEAALNYKVGALPHMILIDREGVMRWRDNPANLADWTVERLLRGEDAASK